MAKRGYHQNPEYGVDDPGNRLRDELSDVDAPDCDGALNELLYTADERGLLDFGVAVEDALTIWRIVEIAKKLDGTALNRFRM